MACIAPHVASAAWCDSLMLTNRTNIVSEPTARRTRADATGTSASKRRREEREKEAPGDVRELPGQRGVEPRLICQRQVSGISGAQSSERVRSMIRLTLASLCADVRPTLYSLNVRDAETSIPDAIVARARELQPLSPCERRHLLRGDAALLVDGLLVRVSRGRGAVDVAMGRALESLVQGERVLRLGFSGIADYARERLGIGRSTANALRRLSRELIVRPVLAKAVRAGEVSARKAQELLPVAFGVNEARWVEWARTATVREIQAAVRAAREGEAPAPDEPFERVWMQLSPEQRSVVDAAMELARKVLGATTPRWELLEAILQEFLGAHPVEQAEVEEAVFHSQVGDWLEGAKEALELETQRWAALDRIGNVAAPEVELTADPFRLDEQLRELGALRDGWDATFGHLAMLMRMLGLWRDLGFASFGHYCDERLGIARRTVDERISLERKLQEFPSLQGALTERRVSYEQARIISRCATEKTVDEWIARAGDLTCIELARAATANEEAQMCGRNELVMFVPRSITSLLSAACRAVREVAGRWIPPGDCLALVSRHFIAVWEHVLKRRQTPQSRAVERDDGLCQVPCCSRAAAHAHHIVYRSHGGGDEQANLVSLCAVHHMRVLHCGFIRAEGHAPDGITWELGVRWGMPPLMRFTPRGGVPCAAEGGRAAA